MCLYPRLMVNKKYTKNKKNGGIIPAVSDERTRLTPIGCGKCMECRKQKAREWQVRLQEEIKHTKNGIFVTLTFSDKSIKELSEDNECKDYKGYELDNAIATRATRLFLERWRKKHKKSVRHWLITELGHKGTENIHMHGIIWTDKGVEEIRKIWQYGYIYPRPGQEEKTNFVSEKTINYIIKYVHKVDKKHEYYKSKVLTSAGIGNQYTKGDIKKHEYKEGKTDEAFRTRTGHKIAIPMYWRNKIWTEEEREKLWIEKLDANVRWVNGIKIEDDEETYWKALKEAQERNTRLGYGNNEIDWEKREYERQRRTLKQNERIKECPDEDRALIEIKEKSWDLITALIQLTLKAINEQK